MATINAIELFEEIPALPVPKGGQGDTSSESDSSCVAMQPRRSFVALKGPSLKTESTGIWLEAYRPRATKIFTVLGQI